MMTSPDKLIARTAIDQIGCCSINRKKKINASGKYELRNSILRINTVGIKDPLFLQVRVNTGLSHEYSREEKT